ncbi:MFS transporter [Synechococcus sp. PCC 7336]|uniref:MFS transporter n=1 Tax=Synechococcus sp. PCC 7336 TaxID=195250 RepID=UPI00034B1609|nr:MFS transporter [Synechococcus sp. PCC 7336]
MTEWTENTVAEPPVMSERSPASPAPEEPTSPPVEEESGRYRDVLKNRNFLALWSGQVFSQLSDKIFLVLLVALIAAHFQAGRESISGWVSAVMVAFTIPAVLFGSLAGVYVDRWSKKWVMVGTNLVRGLLVLAVPSVLWLFGEDAAIAGWPMGFLALLAITFTVSTLTQFFAPAEQTAIPLIVKKRYLLPANSLYTTTMMASVIIGFAIGEPLLDLANRVSEWLSFGPELGSEVFVAGGYLLAGAILFAMVTGEGDRDSTAGDRHIWADLKEGLQYLRQTNRVRAAIIQLVILFSIFAALAVLAVRLAELIPQLEAEEFGILLASAGIGMGLGALVVGKWGDRLPRSVCSGLGSLGMAAALTVLALVPEQLWPSLFAIGVLGFSGAVVGVPMQTLIQEQTPADLRGKVFGLQNNAINIALSLPLALAGLAEAKFGLAPVLWSLAAISGVSGTLLGLLSNRSQ